MKLLKLTSIIIFSTFISKILGLLREVILASEFGISNKTDIYLLAAIFPSILFSIITEGLSVSFIPFYIQTKNKYGENKALIFTNTIINILIISSLAFSIIGIIFTDKFIKLFAFGFSKENLELATSLTRIMFPSIIFLSVTSILKGYLQSNDSFILPAIKTIPYNITIIISIILSNGEIKLVAYGTLLAVIVQFIFQVFFVYKTRFRYKPIIKFKDNTIKRIFKSLIPIIIGLSVVKLNILVDKIIASTLIEGSISALNFSDKIIQVILDVFTVSIGAITYKNLSEKFISKKESFVEILCKSIRLFIVFLIPITMMLMLYSKEITIILFQRGKFNLTDTIMTSNTLLYYSISILGFGMNGLLIKTFFSINNKKIPLINGLITLVVNIFLNILLVNFLSYKGIALATSITSIVSVIFLYYKLSKKYFLETKKLIILLVKVLIISILIFTISKYIFISITIKINYFISFLLVIFLSGILFVIFSYLLKIEDIKILVLQLKAVRNWTKKL